MKSGDQAGEVRHFRGSGSLILATLFPLAAFVLQSAFWEAIQPYAWFLFYPAVFFSSWVGGKRAGLIATVLSAVLVWWAFIPPRHSFSLARPVDAITILIFTVMGALFSLTHEQLRRANRATSEAFSAISAAKDQLEERISERTAKLTRTVNSLRESEARFRMMVKSVEDYAIIMLDPGGLVVNWNPGAERIKGYRADEIVGQHFSRFYLKEDVESGKADQELAVASLEGRLESEGWRVRKDGSRFMANVVITAMRDEEGKLRGFAKIVRDISAPNQAEQALRESEAHLKKAQEIARLGSWTYDLSGRISWSEGNYRNFGVSPETFVPDARSFINLIHPDDRPAMLAWIDECVGNKKPGELEFRTIWPDGSVHFISGRCELVLDAEGNPQYMAGTAVDITERKLAEDALQQSEREFHTLAEAMPQIVWITRPDGWNIYFNQQWVEYTGLTLEESYGHGWNIPFHPDDQQRAWDAWQQATATVGTYAVECRLRRADGAYRWWLIRGVPLLDAAGKVLKWYGTCTDIENLKQVETALRESREHLRMFIEYAPAALAMFDTEMRYLNVSRRWLIDYGLGERDLIGQSHYDIFPEINTQWREAHRRGLAGELLRAEADRFERGDGSVQWVQWEIRPWFDAAGTVGGIVIFTIDVTAIKKTEEILRRYELLARHSRDIFLFVRRDDGLILEANDAAVNCYGYGREELLRLTVHELRAPQARELTDIQMAEADSHGILFETVYRRRNGSTFVAEVSSQGATIEGTRILFSVIRDITERKRAEQSLLESETRISSVFEQAYDGIYIISADNRYLEANERGLELLGYTRDELLKRSVADVLAPHEVARLAVEPPRMMSGVPHLAEWDHVRKDGTTFPGEVSARRLNEHSYLAIVRDLTERRRAEAALHETEARLRLAITASYIGLWDWDIVTDQVYFSREWKSQLGYSEEEIPNRLEEWQSRVHPDDLAPIEALLQRYFEDLTQKYAVEFRLRHKNGSYRWMDTQAQIFRDEAGKPVRVMGCHIDITERKQLEMHLKNLNRTQALRSNFNKTIVRMLKPQELFETTCRIAVDTGGFRMAWIGLLDPQTKRVEPVAYAGEVGDYLEKLNISLDDGVRGRGPTAIALQTGKHVVVNDFTSDPRVNPWRADAVRMGYHASANFPFTVAGEVRGMLALYAAEPNFFKDDEVDLLVELASDITFALEFAEQEEKRQRAEEAIRTLNEELDERVGERTAQLEAVNKELESFSYSVSHDLKAPLRGIAGYSQLLERGYQDRLDDEGKLFIRNVRASAAQMSQLIDDLLNYSRIERRSLQSTSLDLPALVQTVVSERLADIEQAGVMLSVEVPYLVVQGDRDGLAMVMRNLLENAIKFSRDAKPPTVEIGARSEGDRAILWVRDNGIGFDMKFHDRIFEIFQRLQRSEDYAGTGVGLALVRKAMQRMGGRAWAESAPGEGATFFLEIPL